MNEKERFIAELYSAAIEVSRETGMAWQTILAQAAQETGWGQHQLPGTHNIFNIKADPSWHGPSQTFNGKRPAQPPSQPASPMPAVTACRCRGLWWWASG